MICKKGLSAIIAVALIASMGGCANNSSNLSTESNSVIENAETDTAIDVIEDFDVKNLKWGMTDDEVRAHLVGEDYSEEHKDNSVGIAELLFNIENKEFNGYNAKLVLCIEDGIGLTGISYHIEGEKFQELYDWICAEYGSPISEYLDGNYPDASWDVYNELYTIFLLQYQPDGSPITQFSYFPKDCAVDACNNVIATTSVTNPFSGEPEYYCKEHYEEMAETIESIINSVN